MNILVLGSGGREHALAWKIRQSPKCDRLYIAPGNGGTGALGTNLPLALDDTAAIKAAILEHEIQLVIVGPEDPLVNGLVDKLKADQELTGLLIVGPGKEGAQLEGSKEFAKDFMYKYGIPTAKAKVFDKTNIEEGYTFLENHRTSLCIESGWIGRWKRRAYHL